MTSIHFPHVKPGDLITSAQVNSITNEVEGLQEGVERRSRLEESSTPDFPNQLAVVALEGRKR